MDIKLDIFKYSYRGRCILVYLKSPMNYTGGKFKLLPQILPLFPKGIDIFIDMFCGGLDVSLNVEAEKKICNDKECHIIDFYKNIQGYSGSEVHSNILEIVEKYNLNKENVDGYMDLRKNYNENNNWVEFYALLAHSFSHQIRFSKKGNFNMPFGKNRSCYNEELQNRIQLFVDKIDSNYTFENLDFRNLDLDSLTDKSFVYLDPPYIISTATYNEGNGWVEQDEKDLLKLLDDLNEKAIRFGLSNVIELNGKENEILKEWSKKYNIHDLNFNYSNSSYHKKDKTKGNTREVFICNY